VSVKAISEKKLFPLLRSEPGIAQSTAWSLYRPRYFGFQRRA